MEILARWISRWARWILAVTVLLLVLCGLYSGQLAGRLSGGGWTVPGSQEERAAQAQDAGFVGRGTSTVAVVTRDNQFSSPEPDFDRRVRAVVQHLVDDPRLDVRNEAGYSSLPAPQRNGFLGKDGRTTITTLELGIPEGTAKQVLTDVDRDLPRIAPDGMEVHLAGENAAFAAVNDVGAEGLKRAEFILLPLVIAILLLLYRSAVAALLSLLVSVTAIVIAMGVLTLLAGLMDLNIVVQSIATMLGLGVGVDYSLIMIRRYMDEVARDRATALVTTMRTSGHTVVASGTTVGVALATLLIIDMPVIRSLAIAAIIVVALAVLASVVVLPAALWLLGPRVAAWRVPWLPPSRERASGRWDRLARAVMAKPVATLAVSSGLLVALALPALGMRTFNIDASVLPESSSVRAGYDLVEEQFGPGVLAPILVVITDKQTFSGVDEFHDLQKMIRDLFALDHVTRVASPVASLYAADSSDPFAALAPDRFDRLPESDQLIIGHFVSTDRTTIALDVFADDGTGDAEVKKLLAAVRDVVARDAPPSWEVAVGGAAADGFVATQRISEATPLVIAAMLATIYLLLVVTFRSVLLPLKAIALNLLSVAATIGLVVLVFQHGVLADLLGVASVGPIQNFVPILLVAVLFSISTDYEVFLLSRVRERYRETGDNTESVVYGLVQTAPLISGAALLMATIFAASFFAIPLVSVQQTGFAMAVAIVIDATIVRLVMVPAAMRLMGRWNWWLPTPPAREKQTVSSP